MNRSTKYQFYLPQNTDPISVNDFNYNFGIIDENLLTKEQTLTNTEKQAARDNIGLGAAATRGVANNLTTDASGSVLDARQGKTLDDKIGKRALTKYSVSGGSSVSITIENDARCLVIINSTATSAKDLLIVSCSGTGVVGAVSLRGASNISIDTNTANTLKITNNSGNTAQVFVETLQ